MGDTEAQDQQPQADDEEPEPETPPAADAEPIAKPADSTPPPPQYHG